MQVVFDLVLAQRFIDLWPLLVQLAVVDVFHLNAASLAEVAKLLARALKLENLRHSGFV